MKSWSSASAFRAPSSAFANGVYPSGFYPLNIEMILLGSIEFIGLWHNWQNNLGQNNSEGSEVQGPKFRVVGKESRDTSIT